MEKNKRSFEVSLEGDKSILDNFTAFEICESIREYVSEHFDNEVSIAAKEKRA